MRNNIKILSLTLFAASLLIACSKDSEGVSNVVVYPVFEIVGGPLYVTLKQSAGTAFVDPGISAHSGDISVPVTTTGTVDLSTPDLYQLYYSAYDANGKFTSTTDRKVLVTDQPLSVDYSGNYNLVHATRSATMTVIQMVNGTLGWYKSADSWWQASKIPVEFVDLGSSLKVIPGNSNFGPFDGTVTFDPTTQNLVFNLHFTAGVNAGLSWTSTWKKQ